MPAERSRLPQFGSPTCSKPKRLGRESPAYAVVQPCPVLVARAIAPITRITTVIDLPA